MKFLISLLVAFVVVVTRGATTFLGSDATFPYSIPLNTTNMANGTYTFYARGFDPAGNQGFSVTNTVIIDNPSVTNLAAWAQRFGGTGSDIGKSIAVDSSGNIYLASSFSSSASFGGSTLTNAGGNDLALSKYATNGAHLWSVRYGSTGNESAVSIALDNSGNIVLTATFNGLANFGGTNFTVTPAGIALAKYNPSNGAHILSEGFYGSSSMTVKGIAVDASNNLLLTGYWQGVANFGTTNVTSVDSQDMFVAKYSTLGAVTWVKTYPLNAASEFADDIVCDSSSNVFVTGYITGYVNFGAGYIISDTGSDIFVLSLNSSGALRWARGYGGPKAQRAWSEAIDYSEDAVNGRLVIAGDFFQSAVIGSISNLTSTATSALLCKLDTSNGDAFWAKPTGGNLVGLGSRIVAIGPAGVIYLAGAVDTATKNFITATLTPVGGTDIFVSKYTPAGALSWVSGFGGLNFDRGFAIAADSNGYSTATGYFTGTAFFGGTTFVSQGAEDIFLMRNSP